MGSISALLGIVALAGWALLVVGIGLAVSAASQGRSTRGGVTIAIFGVVIGLLFSVISQGIIVVEPQQVAVVFDQLSGQLLTPRGPGVHIIIPVVQVPTLYSVAQREYTMSGRASEGAMLGDDAVVARTSDGQEVRIDATIIYSIDAAQANLVHQRWQDRFENSLIRPTVRGAVRDEVARYGVEEVYSTERANMRDGIEEMISNRLAQEGFIVTDFVIRDIQFSEDYARSIEQKQIAEQDRLRAEQEAERLRIQAAGERDAAIERANGEAQAIEIRAQAEANALALINAQISQNPQLIQWRYVENLADNIQLMLLPSNSPFVFDFQSLMLGGAVGTTTPSGNGATQGESTGGQ